MKLLAIHVQHGAIEKEHGDVVQGALNYKEMKVGEVMTPLEDVFMLSKHARLDFKVVRDIFQQGFSRIPVYGHDREDILGLLLVKDLIFIDPEDATPVENFIKVFGRATQFVWEDQKLDEVLKEFKKGQGHMAIVKNVDNSGPGDPRYVMKGIITLEDIVEEILGDEIVDETDVFVDVDNRVKVDRAQFDYSRLRLLDSQLVSESLDAAELNAIAAHLRANVTPFAEKTKDLSNAEVRAIINRSSVLELARKAPEGVPPLPDDVLYRRGKTSTFCTPCSRASSSCSRARTRSAPRPVRGPCSAQKRSTCPKATTFPTSRRTSNRPRARRARAAQGDRGRTAPARRGHGRGAADATTEEDVGVGENGGATKKRPGLGMRQPSQRTLQQQRRAARAVARRADAKRRPTKDASRADCETDTEHPGEETIRQPSPRSRSMPPARFLDAVTRRSRKEDKKSLLTAEDSDLTDVERGRGDSTSDVDGPVKNGNDRADFGAVQMRENPASALRRPSGVPGFPATDPLGRQPTVDVTADYDVTDGAVPPPFFLLKLCVVIAVVPTSSQNWRLGHAVQTAHASENG